MALETNTRQKYFIGDTAQYPVEANAVIYEGAAVGENGSGYAEPLTAGKSFLGFAAEQVTGGAANGDTSVLVRRRGALTLYISGLAITDLGKPVYASDDGTFTLTPGANTRIGRVIQFVSTGYGIIEFGVVFPKPTGYEVVFAGEHTTVGGNAVEAKTVTGVSADDLVIATLHTGSGTPRTLLTSVASANTITFTFSGDPSTTHVVTYMVLRLIR